MYRDFEDLRDTCPVTIKADIAVDLQADDPARVAAVWPATRDGGFRLSMVQAVTDFWEREVRSRGEVADDHFAIEIVVDSYADAEMGSSLFLDLRAYCGSEEVGAWCWDVLADDALERKFAAAMADKLPALLAAEVRGDGVRWEVEVDEVEEL